jgi:preprotein translocase subunit SecG
VIVTAALIGVVLIQRSDTDGFGLGSGSGSNFMTGRATASLLTRTTSILAGLFIVLSLLLGILAAHGGKSSILDQIESDESAVPLAVEKSDDSTVAAPALNRDAATDTDTAAKKAVAKKAPKAAKPLAAKTEDAPAVPTAE